MQAPAFELIVRRCRPTGERNVVLELESPGGGDLPAWSAGAHIELLLDAGGQQIIRQYSLCGESFSGRRWRIAVHRELHSRGASAFLCDQAVEGARLQVRGPRNHFPFVPDERVTLLAAGIGITPLLPMALAAQAQRLDWQLIYLVRSRADVSLPEAIAGLPAERVAIHCSGEAGRFDLREWSRRLGGGDSVHACGPLRLLDDIALLHEERPAWRLQLERFENPNKGVGQACAFEVVLARSGKRYAVAEDDTILGVLRRAGVDVPSSCCEGVCGSCEQAVLAGTPDHRDAVLSAEERQANSHMMICVSRAATPSITLDL